jgi:negative regulator of flagellin synthesis FlgM
MRIGLNTPDPQSVSTEQTKSTSGVSPSQTGRAGETNSSSQDTVTLSSLATQALATPDVRQDVIARIKHSIDNGQYQIDPKAIAESMLKSES